MVDRESNQPRRPGNLYRRRQVVVAGGAFLVGFLVEKLGWLNFFGGNRRTPESTNNDPQYVKEAQWLSPLDQTGDILTIPVELQLNSGVSTNNLVAVLTVQHQNEVPDPTINANGGWPIADIVDLPDGQTEIVNLALNFDHPNLRDHPIKVGDQFTLAVNIHEYSINPEGKRVINPHGQRNVANYLRLTRGPTPTPPPQ